MPLDSMMETDERELINEFLNAKDVWQHQILPFVGEVPGIRRKTMSQNYFTIMLTCSQLYEWVTRSDMFLYLKFIHCGSKYEKLPALLPSPELTMRSTTIERGSKSCRLEKIHFQFVDMCASDDYKDRFLGMMKYVTWKVSDFVQFDYGGHPGLTALKNDLLAIKRVMPDSSLDRERLGQIKQLVLKNIDFLKLGRIVDFLTFVDCFARFLSQQQLHSEELITWLPVLYAIFEFQENHLVPFQYNYQWVEQLQTVYPEEMKQFIATRPGILWFATAFQKDKNVVMKAVANDWSCFQYISYELASDPDVIDLAVKRSNCGVDLSHSNLINNREFMLQLLARYDVGYKESLLWSDADFIKEALKVNPCATIKCVMEQGSYLDQEFSDEEEEDPEISEGKRRFMQSINKETLLKALSQDGSILHYIDQQDEEMVLVSLNNTIVDRGDAYVSPSLRNNPEVIKACARNLKLYEPQNISACDRDVTREVVKYNGYLLQHTDYMNDKEMVLVAISNYGRLLEKLPDDLRKDRDIIEAALKSNGEAIKFVPYPICEELNVVLAAVRSTGTALRFLPDKFTQNKLVVLEACKQSAAAFNYAPAQLQKDPEVLATAVLCN